MRILLYGLLFGSTTAVAGAAFMGPDSIAQGGDVLTRDRLLSLDGRVTV